MPPNFGLGSVLKGKTLCVWGYCRIGQLVARYGQAFGMQVVWCNRYGQRRERLPGAPDREITTLAALPPLVGA